MKLFKLQPSQENTPYMILKDDIENFNLLDSIVLTAMMNINLMQDLSKADENVIGGIAQDLQQYKGLINLQIED